MKMSCGPPRCAFLSLDLVRPPLGDVEWQSFHLTVLQSHTTSFSVFHFYLFTFHSLLFAPLGDVEWWRSLSSGYSRFARSPEVKYGSPPPGTSERMSSLLTGERGG